MNGYKVLSYLKHFNSSFFPSRDCEFWNLTFIKKEVQKPIQKCHNKSLKSRKEESYYVKELLNAPGYVSVKELRSAALLSSIIFSYPIKDYFLKCVALYCMLFGIWDLICHLNFTTFHSLYC